MNVKAVSVVAIAGPVGGGKTSLVHGLAETLDDAVPIFFDDYEQLTAESMPRIMHWLQSGADVDEFTFPRLIDDLQTLRRGQAVRHPRTQREIQPGRYVILETPFGNLHQATAQQIDLSIWIDTPLDIALARKAREFVGVFLSDQPHESFQDSLAWLHGYFDNYVKAIGKLLAMQRERVSGRADLVLDGRSELQNLVRTAVHQIGQRLG